VLKPASNKPVAVDWVQDNVPALDTVPFLGTFMPDERRNTTRQGDGSWLRVRLNVNAAGQGSSFSNMVYVGRRFRQSIVWPGNAITRFHEAGEVVFGASAIMEGDGEADTVSNQVGQAQDIAEAAGRAQNLAAMIEQVTAQGAALRAAYDRANAHLEERIKSIIDGHAPAPSNLPVDANSARGD
jgi:hypothetical protein